MPDAINASMSLAPTVLPPEKKVAAPANNDSTPISPKAQENKKTDTTVVLKNADIFVSNPENKQNNTEKKSGSYG